MHATLILSDTPRAERGFLGLPVGIRVALSLVQAGVTELSVYGPRARQVCERFARDERLTIPIQLHSPEVPVELVCLEDAWVAPEHVRGLALGEALADVDGQPVVARVRRSCVVDPQQLLDSARIASVRPAADGAHPVLRLHRSADRVQVQRTLFASLIKPSDGPVSRHLNRHISRTITRWVIPLGLTPNGMTVFVAITGLLGAYAASFASPAMQLLGAALYQLHSIIDGCDGEIARLTQRFGKHGALIDSMIDDLCNGAFFFGLSLGVARMLGQSWPVLTGASTAIAYAGVIGLQYNAVLRTTGRGDKTKFWSAECDERSTLFGVFKALLRRDVFVLLILIAVALGATEAAVAVFPLCALGALVASSLRLIESKRTA
ncbi:MAG: CDP-alcohol phosphatidyltransferase family protein [Polyangiales bacterium]